MARAAVAAAPPARLRFFPLSRTQSWCWLSASQKKKLLPMHHFHVPLTLRGRLQRNVQLFLPCWPPPCPFRHGMQLCDTIGKGAAGSAAASRGRLGSAAFTSSAGTDRFAIATRPCVAGSWRRRCQLWGGRGVVWGLGACSKGRCGGWEPTVCRQLAPFSMSHATAGRFTQPGRGRPFPAALCVVHPLGRP